MIPEGLSAAERQVWDVFPRGGSVDLRDGGEPASPEAAAGWPAGRVVRATVLRSLLLGACPQEPGEIAALRLTGCRIEGETRLGGAQVAGTFFLLDQAFRQRDEHPGPFGPDIERAGADSSTCPVAWGCGGSDPT